MSLPFQIYIPPQNWLYLSCRASKYDGKKYRSQAEIAVFPKLVSDVTLDKYSTSYIEGTLIFVHDVFLKGAAERAAADMMEAAIAKEMTKWTNFKGSSLLG